MRSNNTTIELLQSIAERYKNDPAQDSTNFLIYGKAGSGKTYLVRTCRKPILIWSFDPGGTKCLTRFIQEGGIYPDCRWENRGTPEVGTNTVPLADLYELFSAEFEVNMKSGAYNELGTLVLDSLTSFMECLNAWVARKYHRPDGTLAIQDHNIVWLLLAKLTNAMNMLPCDTLILAHVQDTVDDLTQKRESAIAVAGQSRTKLPGKYDELYVALPQQTSKGVEYRLQTANDGVYVARTRIGENRFSLFEPPDIKALLKKAGRRCEDLA